jgi:DNA-binding PadR family transcriptional regulator
MANLILGLLMIRSLTIYDIKNTLNRKISPFFSASFGAIQAAIKKLLEGELITFTEKVENGRNKKEYSLTETGRSAFNAWMREEILVNKFNNDALLRVFFFGFINNALRIELLSGYITRLKIEYDEMLGYQQSITVPPHFIDKRELVTFQLASLDYGIQQMAFEITWYENLLLKLETGNY